MRSSWPDVYEFYNLGIGDPFPISAASMLGLGDMLDEVVKHFPGLMRSEEEEDERPKVAIIGKPNVGKSSLINKLGAGGPRDRLRYCGNNTRCD